jgi:hypothetical protein
MKLLNPEVIQNEEKSLIDAIKTLFRIDAFKRLFKSSFQIDLFEASDLFGGEILVHNNKIVFEMGLSGKVAFSILIDRHGNYLGLRSSNNYEPENEQKNDQNMILSSPDTIANKEKEIIGSIAEGISPDSIRSLFENDFNLSLSGDTQFENGHITIYENLPAYQLNYKSDLSVNFLVDTAGSLIEFFANEQTSEATESDNFGLVSEMV